MPMFLLALLSPRMWFWGAIALLLLALGGQTLRLDHAQTALAREQADRAQEAARLARLARDRAEQNATIQAAHAAATMANADDYSENLRRLAAENSRLAAAGDSLRGQIARFSAAHPTGADADPVACRHIADKAAALGRVLGRYDQFAEGCTSRAEQLGSEVRALKQQLLADRTACTPQP